MEQRGACGVLITGVYGSGKGSVAEEIAYLLEQRGEPYALLDLDYLSWAGTGTSNRASEFGLMLQNLAAVAANYRRAGIRLFVLAYFVRSSDEAQEVGKAAGAAAACGPPEGPAARDRAAAGGRCHQRPPRRRRRRLHIAAAEGAGVEEVVIRTTVPSGPWRGTC